MQSATVTAFKRMKRAEQVLDLHLRARDSERADSAALALDYECECFTASPADTSQAVLIKAREAVCNLAAGGHDSAATLLRAFFTRKATVDGRWLRDLRNRAVAVEAMAPDSEYALALLQSILASVARPRAA